ncbi:MAG: hypothetical protein P8X62_09825 [Flavobacteriaceae bacterium]
MNNYKYVIVPNKYDFLKEADKYQLNSLTKFLFEKEGFIVVMQDDSYPKDMSNNRCLALNSNVLNSSGMFKTKLQVVLKDCNGKIVFETKVGETREKEYEKANQLALRDAFTSFDEVSYEYQPNEAILADSNSTNNNTSTEDEVEKLKEEIKALKAENTFEAIEAVETVAATTVATTAIVKEPDAKEVEVVEVKPDETVESASGLLYAQAIDNGFQLVDSTPKVVYKLKSTGLKNVYLVEGQEAIIYQKDAQWVLEYYENDVLKQEQLPIKF